jgi:hypothetical protein
MRPAHALGLAVLPLLAACGGFYTVPTNKEKAMGTAEEHDHDHEHVMDEKGQWTCPHEGGSFDKPGKCPNSWCGLELVKKKKKP